MEVEQFYWIEVIYGCGDNTMIVYAEVSSCPAL